MDPWWSFFDTDEFSCCAIGATGIILFLCIILLKISALSNTWLILSIYISCLSYWWKISISDIINIKLIAYKNSDTPVLSLRVHVKQRNTFCLTISSIKSLVRIIMDLIRQVTAEKEIEDEQFKSSLFKIFATLHHVEGFIHTHFVPF